MNNQTEISYTELENLGFKVKNIIIGHERAWYRDDLDTICVTEKMFQNSPSDYAIASIDLSLLFEIKTMEDLSDALKMVNKYSHIET